MFEELIQKLNKMLHPHLQQTQREAWLDGLILASFADRKVTEKEQQLIGKKVKPEDWDDGVSYDHFYSGSVVRAREVIEGSRDQHEYLTDIKTRLNHRDRCGELFGMCKELVNVDDGKTKEEKALIKAMAGVFFYEEK